MTRTFRAVRDDRNFVLRFEKELERDEAWLLAATEAIDQHNDTPAEHIHALFAVRGLRWPRQRLQNASAAGLSTVSRQRIALGVGRAWTVRRPAAPPQLPGAARGRASVCVSGAAGWQRHTEEKADAIQGTRSNTFVRDILALECCSFLINWVQYFHFCPTETFVSAGWKSGSKLV